jgi:hypothetical protein
MAKDWEKILWNWNEDNLANIPLMNIKEAKELIDFVTKKFTKWDRKEAILQTYNSEVFPYKVRPQSDWDKLSSI